MWFEKEKSLTRSRAFGIHFLFTFSYLYSGKHAISSNSTWGNCIFNDFSTSYEKKCNYFPQYTVEIEIMNENQPDELLFKIIFLSKLGFPLRSGKRWWSVLETLTVHQGNWTFDQASRSFQKFNFDGTFPWWWPFFQKDGDLWGPKLLVSVIKNFHGPSFVFLELHVVIFLFFRYFFFSKIIRHFLNVRTFKNFPIYCFQCFVVFILESWYNALDSCFIGIVIWITGFYYFLIFAFHFSTLWMAKFL